MEAKEIKKNITSRTENFSEWYQDVIDAADMAEHGPVRGTMVIKPYGYAIWEIFQKSLDAKFKEAGVKNAYFPLLIPEKFLKKEESHIEGFSPEVAVVTHAGGEKLAEPLVIRPTSETIIYEVFRNWIRSHRDLPILINQWANVVRWEMRPRLFLRTTEFLWQEGHTVHATAEEADNFARQMLDVYTWFATEMLAIPVIPGQKSESERFAGALKTYTVEAMMQDGLALQFATSHNLGQNFAKAFDLQFSNENNESEFAHQTSWGLSTRTIGGLIMVHSDDTGLVLPPRVAPTKVVMVPIWKDDASKAAVIEAAEKFGSQFKEAGITFEIDKRDGRPGEKYYEWEKKGVPVRLEIGPRDLENNTFNLVRRDTGEKISVSGSEIIAKCQELFEEIQKNLFERAKKYQEEKTVMIDSWDDFKNAIENGKFVMAHWDGTAETEAKIKEETKATIRCLPFDSVVEAGVCVYSGEKSERKVLFGKSY